MQAEVCTQMEPEQDALTTADSETSCADLHTLLKGRPQTAYHRAEAQPRSAVTLTVIGLPLSFKHQLGLSLASVQLQSTLLHRTGHGAPGADDYARSSGKQNGRQKKPRCQLVC